MAEERTVSSRIPEMKDVEADLGVPS
jgi:hypothetical protein